MIKANNITKKYGDLQVLKGITLEIPDNKIISIVGASGAGKSTLLHILGTIDTPDSGNILYDDLNISQLSTDKMSDFRNRNIGFVFQFHHLLPEFNAIENVCIPALIAGVKHKEAINMASELLDKLGLSNRINHKPSQMSGGEQQRVAIARALINKPQVVFADEPSGNLDSVTKSEIHNLFFKLRDEMGQTFVIVTHDTKLASDSDITISIKDGLLKP